MIKNKFDITFIHTGEMHVATFSALIENVDVDLSVNHLVNSDLLENAMNHGLSESLVNEIEQLVFEQAKQSQLVVCTCSTLGGIVEALQLEKGKEAIRIDRAMADIAVNIGKRILVLTALESTLSPTQELMQSSQLKMETHNIIDYCVVENSWQYFLTGDHNKYFQVIATAINEKQSDYDCIVLAQASMSGAVSLVSKKGPPVLSSPELGVKSMIKKLVKQAI